MRTLNEIELEITNEVLNWAGGDFNNNKKSVAVAVHAIVFTLAMSPRSWVALWEAARPRNNGIFDVVMKEDPDAEPGAREQGQDCV